MVDVIKRYNADKILSSDTLLWRDDAKKLLTKLPEEPLFDLVVTSPPYNINKEYEDQVELEQYLNWQKDIIEEISKRTADTGSICWQVGNYVENGHIAPLDIELHPIFKNLGYKLRNRIIWKFGHGLHGKKRFSGRYEVILWYTKSDDYTFNLDDVRIPSKYPGKRHYKGPNKGKLSGNPLGKNPEDVWDIPNVKSNHIEKTEHPCQFPVGLIERLILALTNKGQMVFDPFCGVGSSGVAALLHKRKFWGCEVSDKYINIALDRLTQTLNGEIQYRPHTKPIYDHTKSSLSIKPKEHKISSKRSTSSTKGKKYADAL